MRAYASSKQQIFGIYESVHILANGNKYIQKVDSNWKSSFLHK